MYCNLQENTLHLSYEDQSIDLYEDNLCLLSEQN